MSGRISIRSIDFPTFLFDFDRVCFGLFRSFLVQKLVRSVAASKGAAAGVQCLQASRGGPRIAHRELSANLIGVARSCKHRIRTASVKQSAATGTDGYRGMTTLPDRSTKSKVRSVASYDPPLALYLHQDHWAVTVESPATSLSNCNLPVRRSSSINPARWRFASLPESTPGAISSPLMKSSKRWLP